MTGAAPRGHHHPQLPEEVKKPHHSPEVWVVGLVVAQRVSNSKRFVSLISKNDEALWVPVVVTSAVGLLQGIRLSNLEVWLSVHSWLWLEEQIIE